MPIVTLGINHHSAPVEIRERLAFTPDNLGDALEGLTSMEWVDESVILSTCNRTEIITWQNQSSNDSEHLPDWLATWHDVDTTDIQSYMYHYQRQDAITHLFRVACGLDSMVLGEPQILGQLKTAYQVARESKKVGKVLDRLFQHAFSVAKRVRTETEIGSNPVSVAYASVNLAKQIFGDLSSHTVLLIGAGETIELTARHLRNQHIGEILIVNRTLDNAKRLAQEFDAKAYDLDALNDLLPKADIVISSTASTLPIVGKGSVERAIQVRKHRPMLMVDLAVPRDIEPEVQKLSDVYLYTVDHLKDIIQDNIRGREAAAVEAEELINYQVQQFKSWLQTQNVSGLITDLRGSSTQVQAELVSNAQRMLAQGKDSADVLNYLANTLTNKLLHAPTTALRTAAAEQDVKTIEAAKRLFNLKDESK